MPELPEVEVVRAGLAPAVTGARVIGAEVLDPRALKRHLPPEAGRARSADFERRVVGLRLAAPERRGKFLWIPVAPERGGAEPGVALLAHLGMSGQLLLRSLEAADDRHVRIRLWIEHPAHGELRLDFADQRLFGSLALDALVPAPGGGTIPSQSGHIARDPLDPLFDDGAFVVALRSRAAGAKKLLLDQTLVSGVGNIYADEALWRARLHPEAPGRSLGPRKARELLTRVREVFAQALAEGGTSFDAQYVNVNGRAGYFARELEVYGRTGQPCSRCGGPIKRTAFMNRSSHFCPKCQRFRGSRSS
ncbi:bifunctional DNA-formamidopyrimidine glycosylase/DNA-(apurinic or apyrimidinic site) lyase [Leucobacter sp. wl10]|uniref:bifunctional DNA-formamidopyrimidine glycosylase/DNA-(apurinic or apyrimidinic site) lyase n=1 Tax=Leucobacter sp. wl10 TaxID=2304677 RepID=UPI000E5C5671|nr:bifunctional DNA-formamidopyrimidine glycosylase/DNA-(apurinic or apyrimidinic site) lyase [Leucobacter sp. wl10]RGE22432.1 bifunctional DNA-formamidopyrimidine glycosylase/DNA-(apurinic or apyrimidinic site) lyase [Leucobacter sp. wl10]